MITTNTSEFNSWTITGYGKDSKGHHARKLIVGIDVEYESNAHVTINMGGRPQPIDQRRWEDIISIQLALNYENNQPRKVFIHREPTDRLFSFYEDIMVPIKQYLTDIGMMSVLRKELQHGNKHDPFTVELWGLFIGVDISSVKNWDQILTEDGQTNKPSNLVSINGNILFTSRPLKLLPRNQYRHRIDLFPETRLVIRDMLKLAPAKSNLARLGDMIHQPKLDTEQWDKEAGLPVGYFKSHMAQLWKQWPNRFEDYAMNDTVVTVLYGSFILDFMKHLNDEGLGDFKPTVLKSSLSSIGASVVARFNKRPAKWITDFVINDLIQMNHDGHSSPSDFDGYLHPICRRQRKNENFEIDMESIYQKFDSNDLSSMNHDDYKEVTDWLNDHLDFDKIRKGYQFPTVDKNTDANHKHLMNDLTQKDDLPKADLFNMANNAFYGGYNIVLNPGILPAGFIKRDLDEKSAYTTGGILSVDSAPGLGNIKSMEYQDVNSSEFKNIVEKANQLNGPYTVGVGSFKIEYPKGYKGYVITPQRVEDGPRYFRTVKSVDLSYTDAYTAWLCGAKVHVNTLKFPVQAKMNPKTMAGVSREGFVQDVLQKRRNKYPKSNPLNEMMKTSSNSVYGCTAESLKQHKSRDFNDNRSYYTPFSQITNPLKAMQYTAITRYHIILMQKAIHQVDPKAVFVNNVTDGSLVMSEQPLSSEAITKEMEKLATPWYRAAVHNHFNGVYFEEKDGTTDAVANLRTRLTFSKDAELHAMVGIKTSELSPEQVFEQYLEQNATVIKTHKRIITSINDMKNNTKFKSLQSTWNQPVNIFLGYDFAAVPTDYHVNGEFCYWDTRFYDDIDDFYNLWQFGRALIKYGSFYSADYAKYFQLCIQEREQLPLFEPAYYGEFVKEPLPNQNPALDGNEAYYNWINYVIKYGLNADDAYQKIVKTIDDYGLHYQRGKKTDLPSLVTFKKYIKTHRNSKTVINYVFLHHLNLI